MYFWLFFAEISFILSPSSQPMKVVQNGSLFEPFYISCWSNGSQIRCCIGARNSTRLLFLNYSQSFSLSYIFHWSFSSTIGYAQKPIQTSKSFSGWFLDRISEHYWAMLQANQVPASMHACVSLTSVFSFSIFVYHLLLSQYCIQRRKGEKKILCIF